MTSDEPLLSQAQIDYVNRHNEQKKLLVDKKDGLKMINVGKMDETDIMLVIQELTRQIHENAVNKGFYESAVPFAQSIALIHSEASEALEAHRNRQPTDDIVEELADIVIRVFDLCGYHEYNVGTAILAKMKKNLGREHKHGKRY